MDRISCCRSSCGVSCKVFDQKYVHGALYKIGSFCHEERFWFASTQLRNISQEAVEPLSNSGNGAASDRPSNMKVKRKKLKGKRAVVRWLKFFRWKKKKDYERMTAGEKILYKLRKAQKKEARIVEALKKIEPPELSEATHDPEILTPEEHFYFLKMGLKCKNYVPVGRRGIYQGVILNMHLHWKKHQTLQVVVKTFTPEEVKEIAAELARLSGGIVLDIHEENTIIMYRGKNYAQPPTEIMSPKITLSRRKALDKSKYIEQLRAVRKFIPRLEQDLELLQVQAKAKREQEDKMEVVNENQKAQICSNDHGGISDQQMESSDNLRKIIAGNEEFDEDDSSMESDIMSDSEALSDIFETDSDDKSVAKERRPLYLDEFDRFPTESNGESEDFEEHLRQISLDSKKTDPMRKDIELPDLDEVDRMFLRAGSLLRKKRR